MAETDNYMLGERGRTRINLSDMKSVFKAMLEHSGKFFFASVPRVRWEDPYHCYIK